MSYRGSGSTGSLGGLGPGLGGGLSSAAGLAKAPTALEQLLEEINFQRTKEMRQLLKDDSGFVMLQGTTYWTDLFVRHFLFQTDHCIDCDDLLFFVRKKHIKGSSRHLPKFDTEVDVFRKASRKLPIGDPDMDWEETVYLNLIIHQFDYTLTLAICTRTSPKELQVLRRHSQKVYASPSRRRMDTKAEVEEMTYPNVCFMVDNFNEVFCDIMVRDGEMVCVELVASDRDGAIQGVIFLGSIRYDALKRVYDARSSLSSKMAQRMTFGLFSNTSSQRVEFVRMKGPQGKGHAEMAVTKPKGYSGAETPTSEPGYCATDMWDSDWDSDPEEFFVYRHQRRLSDPSANIHNFVRGGWKTKPADTAGSKARSENEGLDSLANGLNEIEAGDLRDDCEFCVHSASITTSDASTLPESENAIPSSASSCDTSESVTSTTSTCVSKRLPPASSIISSFFPNFKIKSKSPGHAVRCVSSTFKSEAAILPACHSTSMPLSEVPEDSPACSEVNGNGETFFFDSRTSETASNPVVSVDTQPLCDEEIHSDVPCCEHSHENPDNSNSETAKVCNAELLPESMPSKISDGDLDNDDTDDDFEDCISLEVYSVTSRSHHSAHSTPPQEDSQSQGDVWSDAEEGSVISEIADDLNIQGSHEEIQKLINTLSCSENSEYKSKLLRLKSLSGSDPSIHKRQNDNKLIVSPSESVPSSPAKQRKHRTKLDFKLLLDKCAKNSINKTKKNSSIKDASKDDGSKELLSGVNAEETVAPKLEDCTGLKNCNSSKPNGTEKCAHGVDLDSLCLLCLGYRKYGLRERTDLTDRLKTQYQYQSVPESKKNVERREVCKNLPNEAPAMKTPERRESCSSCSHSDKTHTNQSHVTSRLSQTLPRRRKSESKREITPPHKVTPDGTAIYYWCDVPGGMMGKSQNELDDGAYNPLWTMRGFTQTFHFWKENKRAQSVPLNAFLTYITLPWWSIVKDLLDHRESPVLTF